jgi:hypothetical protein
MADMLKIIASSSSPRNALSVLLRLSIAVPDDGRAASALLAASRVAEHLSPNVVYDVQSEIERDDLTNANRQLRAALQRLTVAESDRALRGQYQRIAEAFGA